MRGHRSLEFRVLDQEAAIIECDVRPNDGGDDVHQWWPTMDIMQRLRPLTGVETCVADTFAAAPVLIVQLLRRELETLRHLRRQILLQDDDAVFGKSLFEVRRGKARRHCTGTNLAG